MKYISHRGNLTEVNPLLENTPDYIDLAIAEGFDVEIDVRFLNGKLYLGHDTPDYLIDIEWLTARKKSLWVHTKDVFSLSLLNEYDLNLFFHEKERHTIIHNSRFIWTHDIDESIDKSIIPLLQISDLDLFEKYKHVSGVCSDYIKILKNKK
jgi:hypothetical protein